MLPSISYCYQEWFLFYEFQVFRGFNYPIEISLSNILLKTVRVLYKHKSVCKTKSFETQPLSEMTYYDESKLEE